MLTAADLSGMREVQQDAMMDTCRILAYQAGATNDYGSPSPVWFAGAAVSCGVRYLKGNDAQSGEGMDEVGLFSTAIRLPLELTFDVRDRIRVTDRFGEPLDEELTYEIVGEPRRGPTCWTVDVRLITDGSD